MSSYFDSASHMAQEALKAGDENLAERIVQQVVDTYGDYMAWIGKHLPKSSLLPAETTQAWEALMVRWLKTISRPLIDDTDRAMKISMIIERLHDFAHAVGSAGLKTRDGRLVGDNPYVAAKPSDMVIRSQKNGRG